MDYKRSGMGLNDFDYPVELVWKSIAGGNTVDVTPLDEDTYLNTEPAPNTVFTRALKFDVNELFSFQIKSRMNTATWTITLKSLGPCKTRVRIDEDVKYKDLKSFLLCRMGAGIRMEISYFMKDLGKKLKQFDGKN